MKSLKVSVPATAANLGPGFDSLAVALDLHNDLFVKVSDAGLEIRMEGEGHGRLPTDASNLIARAAYRLFRTVDVSPPGVRFHAVNRIPLGSGLGSSAAAVVAGLVAADALAGSDLDKRQLLEIAWELEGHADNAAAALYGGLNIVGQTSKGLVTAQIPVSPMRFAIVVPEIALSTRGMRKALPRNVTLQDAALNLGRMGLVVEALKSGDFEMLSLAAEDRLHEPYRTPQIPGYLEARAAGTEAGAVAVTLAGAGPGLIAFAPNNHQAIASAMAGAFNSVGLTAREFVLEPDLLGAQRNSAID